MVEKQGDLFFCYSLYLHQNGGEKASLHNQFVRSIYNFVSIYRNIFLRSNLPSRSSWLGRKALLMISLFLPKDVTCLCDLIWRKLWFWWNSCSWEWFLFLWISPSDTARRKFAATITTWPQWTFSLWFLPFLKLFIHWLWISSTLEWCKVYTPGSVTCVFL